MLLLKVLMLMVMMSALFLLVVVRDPGDPGSLEVVMVEFCFKCRLGLL